MGAELSLVFPPFRVDLANECLWSGEERIALRGKTFAVLRCLLEHPGQLVTKATLLNAVWPDTYVGESALTICIRELRQALGDNPKTPQFVETVHRRGYRFIGTVGAGQSSVVSSPPIPPLRAQRATENGQLTPPLVGREVELAQLHTWLDKALEGERRIVFVTGEPGIGKTTVVEAFLARVAAEEDLWVVRGQCIEHYGAGEAYLPMLEALEQLCRMTGAERLIGLLRQQAPMWLAQLPALNDPAEQERLLRRLAGTTQERMLREMARMVEVLTVDRGLVLWLEDLHWSDYSTLTLLAYLARRQERARLLVIATYRPAEVLAREHPLRGLKQELQLHGHCQELALDFLTEEHVAEYLAVRFSVGAQHAASLRRLAHAIHQRAEGNPLFMVNVVDYLMGQDMIVRRGEQWAWKDATGEVAVEVPTSIREFIEQQVDRVSPEERRVLEAASVAGMKFSAVAAAAGIEQEAEAVEEHCDALVRREQFLRARGTEEWPDGTVAACYGFVHALYQEVLYARVSSARRARLHRRIGERVAEGYRERARELAVELAAHFERGRDYRQAVRYLAQAGENAMQRSAHVEAIHHLTKALQLLKTLPDTPERTRYELTLQTALGVPLVATKGYAAPEVGQGYTRARELCQQVEETPQLFPVLVGLFRFYLVRAEHETARELGEQLLSLAQSVQDPALLLEAHFTLGAILYCVGEFAPAREHLEQSIVRYDSQQHRSHALVYGADPAVFCLSWTTHALWSLGYPDQALQRSQEALVLAQELSHPFSLALALDYATILHQFRRERQTVQERATAAIALCTEQGFAYYLAWGTFMQGWALADQGQVGEGIAQMRQSLAALRTTGSELRQPYYLALLADACGKVGQTEEGLAALAEAQARVNKTGERWYEAELYRLKAELTLQSRGHSPNSQVQAEAEECFQKAMAVARQQSARSLELRAVMSLSRLWQQQGKQKEAHEMLAAVYNWFTEGFDTKDLQEANVLLEELARTQANP